MTLNERIFKIMEEKNIKATELSKILNINSSTISTWKKTGKNPPAEYLPQICELLKVNIYELLGMRSESINPDEQELLNYYRKCNAGNKQIILNAAKSLQEPVEQEVEKSSVLKTG